MARQQAKDATADGTGEGARNRTGEDATGGADSHVSDGEGDHVATSTGEQQAGTAASGAGQDAGSASGHADQNALAGADFPDIADLPYERAREELVSIVSRLEAGQVPLEESMALWRRGEALAAHCSGWLADAQAEIEQATRPG